MEPTPSSSDAADDFHRRPTTTDNVFPLLELPSGVEVALLSVLSAGKGGLKNVLTLRSVCSTTRSWVDNLPKSDADVVFANAQVTIDSDLQSLRAFNASSPPFGLTSLRLDVSATERSSPEMEDEWNCFCAHWSRKLESLELLGPPELDVNGHVGALLDLPNINSIKLTDFLLVYDLGKTPYRLPSSFQTVSELGLTGFDFGHDLLFESLSVLATNTNLRVFRFEAGGYEGDLEAVTQLIKAKKDCPHFQLHLDLGVDEEDTEVFSRLTQSILSSRSQFHLKVCNWEESLFLTRNARSLLSRVEVIFFWTPTQQNSSLLDLPNLKEVCVGVPEPVTAAQLTFPPSLKKISISSGFLSPPNLPETLKNLSWSDYNGGRNQFVSFMNNLSGRCSELERFYVNWKLPEEKDAPLNFEAPPQGFQKLRRLTFWGECRKEDVEYYRLGLKNAFSWRSLQLHWLAMGFSDSQSRRLPMLDEEMMRRIAEGASGKSLQWIHIQNDSVTVEALPILEKLRTLAAENVERRVQREGRGAWQRSE